MNFVFYVSLTSVFWILFSLLKQTADENLLSKSQFVQIVMFVLVFLVFLSLLFKNNGLVYLLNLFVILIFMVFLKFYIKKRREQQFRTKILEISSHLVLKMKSGCSFRHAFSQELHDQKGFVAEKMKIIFNIVSFSQQHEGKNHKKWVLDFIETLKTVDQQPHLAIKRLENYRNRLKVEDSFRQRSNNALRNLKAQNYILTLFYLILFGFSFRSYAWSEYKFLYIFSLSMFSFGIFLSTKIGKRFRWRI